MLYAFEWALFSFFSFFVPLKSYESMFANDFFLLLLTSHFPLIYVVYTVCWNIFPKSGLVVVLHNLWLGSGQTHFIGFLCQRANFREHTCCHCTYTLALIEYIIGKLLSSGSKLTAKGEEKNTCYKLESYFIIIV